MSVNAGYVLFVCPFMPLPVLFAINLCSYFYRYYLQLKHGGEKGRGYAVLTV